MMSNAEQQLKPMKPIWYFVGWMLTIIGVLIVLAGLMNLYFHTPETSVTGYTHPDLWWGGIITLAGIFYISLNRKKTRI